MSASQIESMFFLKIDDLRYDKRLTRKTPKQMMQHSKGRRREERKRVEKTPSRPRRVRCEGSRGRAGPPAATLGSDGSDGSPAATLGSDGSDGSAAGAHGARAAGRPAAAPEARKRPVARLLCVVEPLREVRRTPGHAAARPVCLRNGARRGGGESKLGDVAKTAKLVQGALCVAAAAVPRLAGTGALRGGKAIVPAEEVARFSFLATSHISILQQPFFSPSWTNCCYSLFGRKLYTFVPSRRLTVVQCDIVPEHVFNRQKAKFHWSISPFSPSGQYDSNRFLLFRPVWRGTHLGEVGDLCKLHNNWFVKFGPWFAISPHIVSLLDILMESCCERWMPITFQHALTPSHSYYPHSVKVLKSMFVA